MTVPTTAVAGPDRRGSGEPAPEMLLILSVAVLHAVGWVAAELAVGGIAPLTLAALRFLIAGALLLLFARWRHSPLGTDDLRSLLLVSIIGVAVAHALLYSGLRIAPLADGIVIATALTPTLAVLLAIPILHERVTRVAVVGVAASAVGVSLVVLEAGAAGEDAGRLIGDLLVIGGATATALYTVIGRVALRSGGTIGVTASTTFIGGLVLAPFALVESLNGTAAPWSTVTWAAFLYLTLPSAGLAAVLYYLLVRQSGAARASMVAYITPVLVLAWSVLVQGEPLTFPRAAGAVLAIVGIRLIMRGSSVADP